MAWPEKPCPMCGEVLPVNQHRSHKLRVHKAEMADEKERAADERPRDTAPRPPKRAAKSGSGVPLKVQIELLYRAGGQAVGTRRPRTGAAIMGQAPACAAAWDQFLYRYPALREAIEKGMIAGDILGLIMAHVPIIETAIAEQRDIAEFEQSVFGSPDGVPAAA